MLGGPPAIAILTSLASFHQPVGPAAQQPSNLDTAVLQRRSLPWSHRGPGPADGCRFTQYCTTQAVWVWTPILAKRGHKDATRRVPGATLQHWYSAWMCAPRLYVMRPRLAFVWSLPEFLAGRSSSPSRRNRVTIHFSIPLRFDSRNDGLRPVGGWDVLAAQRSILSSGQKLQYAVFFLVGYCAESRLGRSSAWPLSQRKAPAALAVSSIPSCRRSGGEEKWRSVMHVPITRFEMQPAGSD